MCTAQRLHAALQREFLAIPLCASRFHHHHTSVVVQMAAALGVTAACCWMSVRLWLVHPLRAVLWRSLVGRTVHPILHLAQVASSMDKMCTAPGLHAPQP